MTSKISTLLAFAVLSAPFSLAAPEPSPGDVDVRPAIERMYPTLVRIHVVMEEGSQGRMKKQQGSGSGAIISSDGYVLTNHHVAGRGTRFLCTLSNREKVDATLIGTDALSDLAVIKLDLSTRRNPDESLAVATFGDSDALEVGDVVLAMGCPGGLSQSITRGIVANTAMIVPPNQISLRLDGERVGELVRWIGHDAVIFGGNSGGPLVNLAGEIVGVNEVGIASLGGAIPSNLAKSVAAELIKSGGITRSWIGLEPQPLLRRGEIGQGVLVSSVWKGSPADQAGIKAGDYITHYGEELVADCHAPEDLPVFNAMVLGTAPGTNVTLTGTRDGEAKAWTLTTEVREPNQAKESEARSWGLSLRDLTKVSALEKRRENTEGVLVDSVKKAGPSGQGKPPLSVDDIIVGLNGEDIQNLAQLEAFTDKFTKELTKPAPVLVEFERGLQSLVTVVEVGPELESQRPRTADKPWLGANIQVITDDLAEALGVKGKRGVRVTAVTDDSPASRAGFKNGDLLLKLDGRVISARRPEDQGVLPELIRSYSSDASIKFDIVRSGEPMVLEVQLEAKPDPDSGTSDFEDDRFEFTASSLSDEQRQLSEIGQTGVLIEKVESNGWAALGGLVSGDVLLEINYQPVSTVDELKKELMSYRESKPRSIVFFVQRGTHTQFLEIEPRW
ncbi:PDZ domain-containing protein [Haloferula sp.]|uniref:PDZ domain-containing protein n=1 Tax=Haloferula sp. TaxID=2497595 RepID=UPI003C736405